MQNLKIYAQKTKNGGLDYYTNLYHKDQETNKMKFQKLRVGFKKDQQVTGNITVKSSTLTFDKIKIPMKLNDKTTGKPVDVDVPFTAYRLFIWEYEKTQEDLQKDNDAIANGTNFVKEYVSPEEVKAKYANRANNTYPDTNNTTTAEIEVQDDLEGLELPF